MIGYTLYGQGPEKVLVLHGWFGDHQVWNPTITYLDLNQYTYAFMDYRGYGKSKQLTGLYSMKEIASDAIELVNHLRWERFHVIGHSMGGMVMQRMLLDIDSPVWIKSLIGITPCSAAGLQIKGVVEDFLLAAVEEDEKCLQILDESTGRRLTGVWSQSMVKHMRESTRKDAFLGYLKAFGYENFAQEIIESRPSTPMVVLAGEFDSSVPQNMIKETFIRWYPNIDLHVIGNAGHYPMQETPVILATYLNYFLSKPC